MKKSGAKRISLPQSRSRRIVAILTLALVSVIAMSLMAQVSPLKKGKRGSGQVSIESLSAPNPAKEYIYAGSRLVSTVEPTASTNGDDARFISVCARDTGNAPDSTEHCFTDMRGCAIFGTPQVPYRVEVTLLNSGATDWIPGTYYLASQNPANNTTWGVSSVPIASVVPHGSTVTIGFSAAKPVGSGGSYFNFQWQMFRTGVGFFGEKTRNYIFSDGQWLCSQVVSDSASFVSQSVPSLMFAGKSYSVSVTMYNAGTTTWTTAANYKLASMFPDYNTTWGFSTVPLPSSVPPNTSVTFTLNVTAPSSPGLYNFQWMMIQEGGAAWFGIPTPRVSVGVNKKAALGYLDFNNDGKADIATWNSIDIKWRLDYNLDGVADVTQQFYNSRSDIPCPADYDGDGKADFAVLRNSTSPPAYYLDVDRNGFPDPSYPLWRPSGGTVPVPGDYDGDGRSDPGVFNPSTSQWLVDVAHNASAGLTLTFGASGDIPVPADYNRDGRTDLAVFRPSTGQWLIDTDLNGVADITISFGQNGDRPVPMDYNGDGIADIAVFRPSTAQWLIDTNLDGNADLVVTLGTNGDVPVPGDYNGDGKTDIAVFRPSTSQWFIDTNNDGVADVTVTFSGGDVPLRRNGWILRAMGITP